MNEAQQTQWERAVAHAKHKTCSAYSSELWRAAETESEGQAPQVRLLAAVTSMVLVAGSGVDPLKPVMAGPHGRTATPEDLSDSELDELENLLPQLEDAELVARVCDVLWTRRRSPVCAQRAVDAYLKSASELETSGAEWRVRVERALAFATVMKDRVRVAQVVSHLKTKLEDKRASYSALSALQMLLRCDDAEPGRWASCAEACAKTAAADCNFLLERDLHSCAAKWYRKNNDAEAERRSLIAAAETYVAEAEHASDAESALLMKAHLYQQAIEAFRRVGKCRDRVDELHVCVLGIQERAAATMTPFEGPTIDLTDMALGVIKDLDGRPFLEALLRLATIVRMPAYAETRRQAEDYAKEFPLSHLFGRQTVNEKGRVVAKAPAGTWSDPSINERALLASMYSQHENARGIAVTGMIEPARKKIWSDHAVGERDFLPLVSNNPIVPQGREHLFARALYAGLTGDLPLAAHLAIPQIEHAVRALLNQRNVITTSLGDDGLQDENSLGTLLDKEELRKLLGGDRVFDMKSLLTERGGANLRNRAAHGLMSHDEFFTVPVAYLWWLLLHLCFLPTIASVARKTALDAADTTPGAPDPAGGAGAL